MIWRCAIAILFLCATQIFFNALAKAPLENSEETEAVGKLAGTPTPTPAGRRTPGRGGPTIELGTTKSSPSPPDALSIAKPPSQIDSRSTSPPAANNFIVAIDIGHTKNRGGAVSARGVSEYVFNERLSRELFKSLQATRQFRSLLINPGGGDISLVKRSQVANERNADLFIAIHHDSVKDSFLKEWAVGDKKEKYCDDFHGFSIFFSRKNVLAEESKAFAMQLGDALVEAGFTPTLHHWAQEHRPIIDPAKGVYAFDDLLVLKNAKMPAALLECGVIVNRNEEQDLNSPQYRARMITAIESAISNFAATQPGASKKK
jgi:N-acetylmuramoyl-L-alanine amidase